MQIIIDLPTRQYNNIKDLANTRLADNISYRGIIIEALGSIKRGIVLSEDTNSAQYIKKVSDWYNEAVKEDGVCYLTSEDKDILAYALKCMAHYETIKHDLEKWGIKR